MLLGHIAADAEMLRLAEIRLKNPTPVHNGPLNHGLERMAAPGRTLANPLIVEMLRARPNNPAHLLRALGKSQDEAAIPVLLEHLSPSGPRNPRTWEATAWALAQYPGGAALLRQAIEGWLAEPKPEDGALQAAIGALEGVGSAADGAWLEETAERLSPRARISARAAARRMERAAP